MNGIPAVGSSAVLGVSWPVHILVILESILFLFFVIGIIYISYKGSGR
jgi:hypothetical protein